MLRTVAVWMAISFVCSALTACSGSGEGNSGATDRSDRSSPDIVKWRALVQDDPTNALVRLRLADGLSSEGRMPEALAVLTEGIRIDSGSTVFRNARASLLTIAGDTAGAMAYLERSLQLDASQKAQWLELGFLHAGRGEAVAEDIAQSLMREGLDNDTRAQAWYLTGLSRGNRGDAKGAIQAYDSSIVLRYGFLDAHIEKGILQHGMGRFPEALGTFRLASAVDKSNADAWHWQGECLEVLGETEDAADAYARALALDTTIRAARRGLERTTGQLRKEN